MESLSTVLLFLILSSSITFSTATTPSLSLTKGSSLYVDDVLSSPNGVFSVGFYPVGDNAYCFSIWIIEPFCVDNCTVVWMANRDYPVNGKYSKLSLLESGNVVLTDAARFMVWSTNTASSSSSSITYLSLHDTGNLVLCDSKNVVLWQSFDSPTDTLLPHQPLTKTTKLVSSKSRLNCSSGFYKLFFDDDNILRLLYDGPKTASIFWPKPWLLSWDAGRSAYNDSRIVVLDSFGKIVSSDNFTVQSSDYGARVVRRLTLDFDGNLRLYSAGEEKGTWIVSWQAMLSLCMIHGACGQNSLCTFSTTSGRECICMPGYKMVDRSDWSLGCKPKFSNNLCNVDEVEFVKFRHVEFYGYQYNIIVNYTEELCKKECFKLCKCKGYQVRYSKAYYPTGVPYCYLKSQLLNGQRTPNYQGDFYLKVPKHSPLSSNSSTNDFTLECSRRYIEKLDRYYTKDRENQALKFLMWFACGTGVVEILCVLFVWSFLLKHGWKSGENYHLVTAGGMKKFTYFEMKKATNGFKDEIGRGAGGIVYKGVLSDNRVAAIKRLNNASKGEAEFLAEVTTIGRLNHMNLIEIWGYCADGKHRILVYKYMEHGSLADNLASNTLTWETRYEIAVGTAKCLAYLHEECLEWVLHCDVKPQNILLDSDYKPKVSDFGLSRLLNRRDGKNSTFSRMRGTRGYMAPEWLSSQQITSKVDVYSYGIVLLEIVSGTTRNQTEKKSFVSWIDDIISKEDTTTTTTTTTNTSWMEEIVDPVLLGRYDEAMMETMISVAMQCVDKDKDERPTMSKVVEMLLSHENINS